MPETLQEQYLKLVQKYLEGTAAPFEIETLERYYMLFADRPEVISSLTEDEQKQVEERLQDRIQARIKQLEKPPVPFYRRIGRYVAVASIILGASVGLYFLVHKKQAQQTAAVVQHDIAPGHNQATLTLANGKKIILTKGLSGLLAVQGNSTVKAAQDSGIRYSANNQQESQISYNTLSTARGEASPYPLVLADGTKVWLNAESSITFPAAFSGKERIVKVTGEAYFEVVHNDEQPFKVQTVTQTIEDIGTDFDVVAYADESAATTLIKGSVSVNGTIIKPGQQTDGKTIKTVNISQIMAWKDGKFRVSNDNIQTVMRQLARWYDIDVSYAGTISSEGFNAKISRDQNISVILRALERTNGVHFKIEGRRVTVIE